MCIRDRVTDDVGTSDVVIRARVRVDDEVSRSSVRRMAAVIVTRVFPLVGVPLRGVRSFV